MREGTPVAWYNCANMEDKHYTKKCTIREIVDFFKFEQVTGNERALDRWTVVSDVNRPGFELCGFNKITEPRRIVIIGNKESEFILNNMTEQQQRERFPMITDGLTPCAIITKGNEVPPILKEVAQQSNFPILLTHLETYRCMTDLITFLDEKLAPEDTMSGVLMSIHGVGVMLTGESGMGKSEAAMELIRNGNVIISDDRVDVMRVHNSIIGKAPEILYGLLEIRGIGIIDVEKMFGAMASARQEELKLVIHLVPFEPDAEYNRIGDETVRYTRILDVLIPTLVLPVSAGRNTAALIESAVSEFKLKMAGFNSAEEIRRRFYEYTKKQSEMNKGDAQ